MLRYARQAAYPFYIVHLPLATLIAYVVVPTSLPAGVKYTVIVVAAIGGSIALYELLIRRVNVLRVCFGLTAQHRAPVDEAPTRPWTTSTTRADQAAAGVAG